MKLIREMQFKKWQSVHNTLILELAAIPVFPQSPKFTRTR